MAEHLPPIDELQDSDKRRLGVNVWLRFAQDHERERPFVAQWRGRSAVGWTIHVEQALVDQWPPLEQLSGLVSLPGMGNTRRYFREKVGSVWRELVFHGPPTAEAANEITLTQTEAAPTGIAFPTTWDMNGPSPDYLELWRPV
jgi:hypothetical protein